MQYTADSIERMGRPRKTHRDLPPYLYKRPDAGTYYYKHPVTKRKHSLGRDRAAAISVATRINALLAQQIADAETIAGDTGRVVYARAVEHFRQTVMPARHLKPKTVYEHGLRLDQITRHLGRHDCDSLTVRDFSQFLASVTKGQRARQAYRSLLVDIGRAACAEGWMDYNHAETTVAPKPKRQRARLTAAAFDLIRDSAPAWFAAVMDLDRYICLRESDLALLQFPRHDAQTMRVALVKSEDFDAGQFVARTHLEFQIDDTLRGLLAACRDDVLSPYVAHYEPRRRLARNRWQPWRQHHTQVSPDTLSRAFLEARDAAVRKARAGGNPEHIAALTWPGTPPTFHEMRALGAFEHEQRGMPVEQVQALLGHTEIETTKIYLNGHARTSTVVSLAAPGDNSTG